jgi:hypothetical protein
MSQQKSHSNRSTVRSQQISHINPVKNIQDLLREVGNNRVIFDSCFIRGLSDNYDFLSQHVKDQTQFVGLLGVQSVHRDWYSTTSVMRECTLSFSSLNLNAKHAGFGYSLLKRAYEDRLAVDKAFFQVLRNHERLLDVSLNYNELILCAPFSGLSNLSDVDKEILQQVIEHTGTRKDPLFLCSNDADLVAVARGYVSQNHSQVHKHLRCLSNYFGVIKEWTPKVCAHPDSYNGTRCATSSDSRKYLSFRKAV